MAKEGKQSYYEVLDVSFNANPEVIRTAYIRAKNAYNRDSLAAYSLFDREESKRILDEIEEAYSVISDSDKRRKYDESHGIVSSESVYESYHKGNHAVAAFARDAMNAETDPGSFSFDEDPFRKFSEPAKLAPAPAAAAVAPQLPEARPVSEPVVAAAPAAVPAPKKAPEPSHIERLRALQDLGQSSGGARNYQITRSYESNEEMEDKIKKLENVSGAWLRSVREYKKVTAEEMINVLKISKIYLTALEEDDIARLPASVFVRGFVIQYGKALKLDHEKLAASYMVFLRSKRPA